MNDKRMVTFAETAMKKRVACYCRVSTGSDEQKESLTNQMEFFTDFAKRENLDLVKVYADEGIKGTQLKKREQFKKMIVDAERGLFDIIFVKDVSRFSRNTVDFLQNIRLIKSFGVNVYFLSNALDIMDTSEMVLTMLAMMAQEESSNLSGKTKFGKNITAKKGRVPNFVFGYDKVDNYTLVPNAQEKAIVQLIFDMYVNQGYGVMKIAEYLNKENIVSKKGNLNCWHQCTLSKILRNQLYIGKVINKKSEVEDFLTGKRKQLAESEWQIVERPEFQIVDKDIFEKAQKIIKERQEEFGHRKKRPSIKYPLSNLLKCSECGYSFRRLVRQYSPHGKKYISWSDSLRNSKGTDACVNMVKVYEDELMQAIKDFLQQLVKTKSKAVTYITNEIKSLVKKQTEHSPQKDLEKQIAELQKEKNQEMEMWKAGIITTMEELQKRTKPINDKISQLSAVLQITQKKEVVNINIEKTVAKYFDQIKDIVDRGDYSNLFLKSIFKELVVYPDGVIKASLKIDSNINIDLPLDTLNIPLDTIIPFKKRTPQSIYKMEWFAKIC